MIHYMKRVAQVMILTVVLVFSTLLVINSDVVIRDVDAGKHYTGTHHFDVDVEPCDDIAYHWYDFYY